ncbi:MAG: T9SS type A sorting domain-containing protein [Bacteroidota bacterium]
MPISTARRLMLAMVLLLTAAPTWAQQVVTDDINGAVTWTANTEYVLNGLIFVNEGAVLTIEPGTVIKARAQENITGADAGLASALIVRKGGRIEASGTAGNPIIFTSEFDDVADPADLRDAAGNEVRGLWGGIVLLGRASTNQPGPTQIEGIDANDEVAEYGVDSNPDDNDSSGILRYVSIRHAGFSVSGVEGDELNGLTMGAVGRGTTIEYVEVFANFDDCFEWFGGTVNTKYLVGALCGDDTFDYDEGFRGNGQFWFSIHDTDTAGRSGEHDGGNDAGDGATPLSRPVISNVTYIGSGAGATVPGGDNNDRTFAIRDAAGGFYYNSVFTDFPGVGVNIEDLDSGVDSRQRLEEGDLDFVNNVWFGFGGDILPQGFVADAILADQIIADPQLSGISRSPDGGLDPRPNAGGAADNIATYGFEGLDDPFFTQVEYAGAFGNTLWIDSWTGLAQGGYVGDLQTSPVSNEDALPQDVAVFEVYPNPFAQQATVRFGVESAQDVDVAVFDMLGRRVAQLAAGTMAAGSQEVTFEGHSLPSGVYFVRVRTEAGSAIQKVSLVK